MGRNSTEEAQQTRARILVAALDLFSEYGYSKTSFQAIAERIGLSKGAVYGHFRTKTALLIALLDYGISEHEEATFGSRGGKIGLESLADFRELYVNSITLALTDPELRKFEFFVGFQMEWSTVDMGEIKSALAELRNGPLELMAHALDELEGHGQLPGPIEKQASAFALTAFWKGAVRLGLLGLETPEAIRLHAGHSFDQFFHIPNGPVARS